MAENKGEKNGNQDNIAKNDNEVLLVRVQKVFRLEKVTRKEILHKNRAKKVRGFC